MKSPVSNESNRNKAKKIKDTPITKKFRVENHKGVSEREENTDAD